MLEFVPSLGVCVFTHAFVCGYYVTVLISDSPFRLLKNKHFRCDIALDATERN